MRKLSNEELNRLTPEAFKQMPKMQVIAVLDNIRSMHNIGSVFRTADAFGLEAVYLCGITATPPNKEIYKTALGATESVHWKYFSTTADALKELKNCNYKIIAIEQFDNSIFLNAFSPEPNKQYAMVFGNEINGIDEALIPLLDSSIEIPQSGTKHSLNIAVSAGVVLWDFFHKINSLPLSRK